MCWGGQDDVVVGLFHVEQGGHEVAQHLPLVEPQTVDHHEQHSPRGSQHGDEEFGAHVHGERRPVALGTGEPAWILAGGGFGGNPSPTAPPAAGGVGGAPPPGRRPPGPPPAPPPPHARPPPPPPAGGPAPLPPP